MVVVAIAGATTGLGLTFLRVLANEQDAMSKHTPILLSRSAQPDWAARGFDVRQVDYANHEQLVQALQGVHTVLSFMGASQDAVLNGQLALVKASKQARVKRFAPSEYAGNAKHELVDLYKPKAVVLEEATKAGLEVTQFQIGLFMGALATGTPLPLTADGAALGYKTGEEEALGGLRPMNFVINAASGTCDNVGDGSAQFAITNTRDVARFVIAALDLPVWPEKIGMRGSVTSFNDIVAQLEKVQGRKFLTRSTSVAELQSQIDHDEDMMRRFFNQARIAMSTGWAMVEPDLNKAFPHIKPVTMEEFVEEWWSGVELPEASWASS